MMGRLSRRAFLTNTLGGGAAAIALPRWLRGAAAATTATQPAGKPFFFLQMADPQLFWGPTERWGAAIAHANRLRPAFVVVSGDLIHGEAADLAKLDLAANEKMAQGYLEIAAKLDKAIPLYAMAGNHDVGNIPTPETLAWYQKRFGKLWYSFEHGGSLFIVLDSNIMKRPDNVREMADKQMAWLGETLRAPRNPKPRHTIIFTHYTVCLKSLDEKEDYHNLPIAVRKELMELFAAHGVKAVFSGHIHKNALLKAGDIELVASCSVTKPLGKDPAGLRIVKVLPDRIEHTYYGMADVPEKVELGPAGTVSGR